MNTEPQDQSAFPVNCMDKGLSKKEYFAALAMQGILANESYNKWDSYELMAKDAVYAAESLIAALNKATPENINS